MICDRLSVIYGIAGLQRGIASWLLGLKRTFWPANANFVRFAVCFLLLLDDVAAPFFIASQAGENCKKMENMLCEN